MNILRHPRWGRAQETYGEDTLHLGAWARLRPRRAAPRDRQREALRAEQHRGHAASMSNVHGRRALAARGLPAPLPQPVQQAHVGSVMAAYNTVNGQYCAENVHLLHDILKRRLGLSGLRRVGLVRRHAQHGARRRRPGSTSRCRCRTSTASRWRARSTAGTVSQAVIDDAVRRVLRAKLCFRLDTDPPRRRSRRDREPGPPRPGARGGARGHRAAEERPGDALPLDRSHGASLAVVGEPGGHRRTSVTTAAATSSPSFAVTPLDGIREQAPAASPSTTLPARRCRPPIGRRSPAADAAIVVVGLTADDEGEKASSPSATASVARSAAAAGGARSRRSAR